MGDRDEDLSPESKAERERMRRQANNARERWVCIDFLLLCTFFLFCLYRSLQGGGDDDDDDPNISPESKAERERIRRQANNNRERYDLHKHPY